ncbi:hypothetical protein EI94DRAFT_1728775 [Lactarius quietus]|nr:hypothetical protein EI94DRAFT_1728775 [Lactarius quietus]
MTVSRRTSFHPSAASLRSNDDDRQRDSAWGAEQTPVGDVFAMGGRSRNTVSTTMSHVLVNRLQQSSRVIG